MSTLLDEVSLVVVPSGYKAGKVYSEIPTGGDGDLTFTRASSATRVNSDGLIEVVGSGVPRLDYSQGSCPALLLEPQRTNLALYSEQFDNGVWAQTTATISPNTTISPSGLMDADTITNVSGNQVGQVCTITSGQAHTFSIYLKRINGSGSIRLVNVNGDAVTVNVTNEWARYNITATSTSTTGRVYFRVDTVGDSIAAWGAQLEQGAYATSYIPTTSATVTRLADSFSRDNIYTNGLITSSGGTWYVELKNNLIYTRDSSGVSIAIGDGTANYLYFAVLSTGRLQLRKRVLNVETILYTTLTDTIKVAIKWNGTNADIFVNGVKVVSATAFTTTNMEFLNANTIDVPKFIQAMQLYPTPLSDSDCISLTT